MVIAFLLINNKDKKSCFFKKTFLLADINIDVASEILFLILNNIQINFNKWEFKWTSYTTAKALSTIRLVKLFRKKKFAIIALGLENKIFIIYVASIASSNPIHHFY